MCTLVCTLYTSSSASSLACIIAYSPHIIPRTPPRTIRTERSSLGGGRHRQNLLLRFNEQDNSYQEEDLANQYPGWCSGFGYGDQSVSVMSTSGHSSMSGSGNSSTPHSGLSYTGSTGSSLTSAGRTNDRKCSKIVLFVCIANDLRTSELLLYKLALFKAALQMCDNIGLSQLFHPYK